MQRATRTQRSNLHGDLVAGRVVEKGLVEERVGRHVVPVELFEVLILLAAYATWHAAYNAQHEIAVPIDLFEALVLLTAYTTTRGAQHETHGMLCRTRC